MGKNIIMHNLEEIDFSLKKYKNIEFRSIVFQNIFFQGVAFIECSFNLCKFIDCGFSSCLLNDTYFYDCNFHLSTFYDKGKEINFQQFLNKNIECIKLKIKLELAKKLEDLGHIVKERDFYKLTKKGVEYLS